MGKKFGLEIFWLQKNLGRKFYRVKQNLGPNSLIRGAFKFKKEMGDWSQIHIWNSQTPQKPRGDHLMYKCNFILIYKSMDMKL